ncbi:hypothetical protein M758_4G098100 [Ceratodon purpureus]|nr:hypothetical protein M758_4G098100 [Ceratodon purpureus]
MSRPRRPVQSWVRERAECTSLWEAFLHFLLSLFVLLRKVRDFLSSEVSDDEIENFQDAFATLSLEEQVPEEGEDIPPQLTESRVTPSYTADSSSSSPNANVRDRLWRALNSPPTIAQLDRLCGLSLPWREYMNTTLEWTALEFTRMDTPGYIAYIDRHQRSMGLRMRYRTLRERFQMELDHFRTVLEEPLVSHQEGEMDPETTYYAELAAEFS